MIARQLGAWRWMPRLARRHIQRRPLESIFLVVGVAIGVAMVIAIDLANASAQRAFELGTEAVTGRSTHQIVGGSNGLDEAIYTDLRRNLGYRLSAPVVEDYVIATDLDGQPMRLFGIDPFAEGPFRNYLGDPQGSATPSYLGSLLVEPQTVLIGQEIADRYGLKPGDQIRVRVGIDTQDLTVVGLLQPVNDLSRRALDGLLIADVATAQEVLDRVGRLTRIDLIVPQGPDAASALEQIAQQLPAGVRIEEAAARSGTVNDMIRAFRLNLTALSLLALVVGVFLIYNTVSFNVVQRRATLGSLRALGMTRREVFGLIMVEAVFLGAVGSVIGAGLGILLGSGAVRLVSRTINDLFFVLSVRDVDMPVSTLIKGGIVGVGAALLGAVVPALEATGIAPVGAMRRSHIEERARGLLPWLSLGAIALLVVGALLLIPSGNLAVTFGALFAIVVGAALLTPAGTVGMMKSLNWLGGDYTGPVNRMALRSIMRSLSRLSIAVAALMVSVSVIIGVSVMIGSFRHTVENWLDDVLQADIFISPPTLTSNQVRDSLDPAIAHQIARFPGIMSVATSRGVDAAMFAETDLRRAVPIRLVALSADLAGPDRRYRSAVGDWSQTWEAVQDGAVVVNEPMANRHGLSVGDNLLLQTDQGRLSFPIAGVAVDFDVNATAFLHDAVYRRYWNDDDISAIGAFVEEGIPVEEQVAGLRRAFGGDVELLIRSNRSTRESALEVFDRTFAITVALRLLATLVAFIGILSTLMSLQLERRREIGVLRSTGMTRRQLWHMAFVESGLIGTSAGLLAMPTGFVLAVILIYIINLRSFGWTLELRLQPQEFLVAFAVALTASLLAGVYPAWRMGNTPPADAVRSE